MGLLTLFQTDDQTLMLLQTKWKSQLDTLLKSRLIQGLQLSNVTVSSASPNVINHLLAKTQQGWFITDATGPQNISRSQPFNDRTLTLVGSVDMTIALWVY